MPHRRYRIVLRCLVLALIAVLAGDLLDTACDPLPQWTDRTTVGASSGGDADQCTGTCVADCYCCSALDGPIIAAAADPLGFLRMAAFVITHPGPSRTTAPPDQPPTRL